MSGWLFPFGFRFSKWTGRHRAFGNLENCPHCALESVECLLPFSHFRGWTRRTFHVTDCTPFPYTVAPMPTFHFLGQVVPSTAYKMTIKDMPQIHFHAGDGALDVDLNIRIENSAVDVQCITGRFGADTLSQVYKIAYDLARAVVNLFVFASGITLSVVFDQFIDPNGVLSAFALQDFSRVPLCTAFSVASTDPTQTTVMMGDMTKLVFAEPALFLALDDLITATTLHHLIIINSARSIEALRHAMAPAGMSRNDAWELFRSNLKMSKEYLRLITDNSQSGRHGENKFVPGETCAEIINRSWIIMNRFLEFRKRGNQPLPESEFPMLL